MMKKNVPLQENKLSITLYTCQIHELIILILNFVRYFLVLRIPYTKRGNLLCIIFYFLIHVISFVSYTSMKKLWFSFILISNWSNERHLTVASLMYTAPLICNGPKWFTELNIFLNRKSWRNGWVKMQSKWWENIS